VYNLNYTPATLGVQSLREIISGVREQKGRIPRSNISPLHILENCVFFFFQELAMLILTIDESLHSQTKNVPL
jgi:hypothetical protein